MNMQIFRRLDHLEAVDISSLEDADLKQRLVELFTHLHLLKTKAVRSFLCSVSYFKVMGSKRSVPTPVELELSAGLEGV